MTKDPLYKTESQLTPEDKASGRYVKMNRAQRRDYARKVNSVRKQNAKKTKAKIKKIESLISKTSDRSEAGHDPVRTNQEDQQGVFGKRSIPETNV